MLLFRERRQLPLSKLKDLGKGLQPTDKMDQDTKVSYANLKMFYYVFLFIKQHQPQRIYLTISA
ncbi:MAG: hypothetical protein BTN85_0141 [Candidatus Methanohalarchaeum thermophilum]|uniref:Uncharacterized protein n=1 Tax=Methanohalarchaeum thermophilum TaxID=1903181 RepID=A0A1Q6DTK2_METT1|nr:MAG: hypothetical protein BTN85_0141 [Candidatus Methanohalarchaeum thermophilum]